MNSRDIVWRLAQLASLPFQERYVINGNKEEYVLYNELLENVDSIKYLISTSRGDDLSGRQVETLQQLFACIDAYSGEALEASSPQEGAALIRSSQIWKILRTKAEVALEAFGFSSKMSVDEINQLSE